MPKNKVSPKIRAEVQIRASGCCEYCRSQEAYSPDAFAIEHIVPENKGGTSAGSNLAYSCQGCNNHKFTATEAPDPINGDDVPLSNPRSQKWTDHFMWSSNFEECLGLTPTGRATVERLRLNRSGVVNLRHILFAVGLHPPEDVPPAASS